MCIARQSRQYLTHQPRSCLLIHFTILEWCDVHKKHSLYQKNCRAPSWQLDPATPPSRSGALSSRSAWPHTPITAWQCGALLGMTLVILWPAAAWTIPLVCGMLPLANAGRPSGRKNYVCLFGSNLLLVKLAKRRPNCLLCCCDINHDLIGRCSMLMLYS